MPSLELIQLILSALSQSFIFSQLFSYNQEIVDGGTQNRIWSFMSTLGLLSFAFSPLSQLFPATNLSFYTYSIMAVSGLVQYVASIAHANQMAINQNEREKIQTLPYDLHNNQSLMQLALFLSRHFGTACLAIYMTSIIGCAFFGAPLYAYTSLALYSVEILNKNGYLPSFLRTPYLYANILILIVSIFGVTSWLSVGLSAGMIGFTVYDYIRCHFYGADSPTAQFPMADASKKLTVEPIEEQDSEAEEKLNFVIQKHIRCKDQVGIHVTFNHFYQSYHIMDKILSNAPEVNYSDYAAHFNGLKTHRAPLRRPLPMKCVSIMNTINNPKQTVLLNWV